MSDLQQRADNAIKAVDKAEKEILDNLALWNLVEKTNPADTKRASNGKYDFTTVCSYSQIKTATENWGPFCSAKWGVRNEKFNIFDGICLYTADMYYPEGSIQLHSDIKVMFKSGGYNDNWSKKVATDALTKGLSKLGYNADIFLGKFDDNKYVQERYQEEQQKKYYHGNEVRPQLQQLLDSYVIPEQHIVEAQHAMENGCEVKWFNNFVENAQKCQLKGVQS